MIQPVSCSESQPLLRSPIPQSSIQERLVGACILPRHLCPPSKSAILILIWSAIVGTVYILAMDSSVALAVAGKRITINGHKHNLNMFINVLVPYAGLAFVLLMYPLSGFIADVRYGRYKTVICSLCILVCSFAFFTVACIEAMISIDHDRDIPGQLYDFGKYFMVVIALVAFLSFTVGLSGFQANFIQLGLDQLLEAPSEYLGLFVHWAIWTSSVTTPIIHLIFAVYACTQNNNLLYGIFSLPIACFVVLSIVLLFSCRKKHWFYSEPGQHNPYKTVVKVLHFARKHKYPISRSAFTYYGDERPSRIDYAKERYGGPFKTEQVEDVKTFLRVLLVLLALGPVFLLEIPVSYFVFPSFTLHTGNGPTFKVEL